MRISQIKLAGFKSFVDPTLLSLPGNLTGIVGPNGCGKSNVIDGLQWVLGESSAKHLRGDSMADVIFNGSSARKPVGQATVEIVFDNADGGLGGHYAGYAEISIKRQVTRDGISTFYLNGSRCRRRDITDLFLGTGVGSRSYSVIAQGMISRVIEAKPEELRLFLEEAAGVSKYKERRRETEGRIHKANDNLARLNDIRVALDQQLGHLQSQAKAAEKFHRLKDDERRLKAELLALAWRGLHHDAQAQQDVTRQRQTAVEAALARLRSVETEIERAREAQAAATEDFNEVQAKYYRVGSEISRLEQAIQHHRERRIAVERDLAQAGQDLKAGQEHVTANELDLEQLQREIKSDEPEHERWAGEEQRAYERLVGCEQDLLAWQTEWDGFNQCSSESLRDEKGELTRLEHLETSIASVRARASALREEHEGLAPGSLEDGVQELGARLADASALQQDLYGQRAEKQARLRQIRADLDGISLELDHCRGEQQVLRGRLASLEALRQAAHGSDQGPIRDWIEAQGLGHLPRLVQRISVDSGWETAAETVLGVLLQALPVDRFDALARQLPVIEQGSLALIDSSQTSVPVPGQSAAARLSHKTKSPWPLDGLLHPFYAVATLDEALALRSRLAPHESVVTRAGEWLGPNWLRVTRAQDASAGVIQREREIKDLIGQDQDLQQTISEHVARLDQARDEWRHLEREGEEWQAKLADLQEQVATLRSDLAAKQAQLQQTRLRDQHIEAEIADLLERERRDCAELAAAQARLGSIRELTYALEAERAGLVERRDRLREDLQAVREDWRAAREQGHAVALRLESMRSRLKSIEETLRRNLDLVGQMSARCAELRTTLAEGNAPLEGMKAELDQTLARRVAVEAELAAARTSLQSLDATLRERERERSEREQDLQSLRGELEQARVDQQATRVRLQGYQEQLDGTVFQLDQLLSELPAEAERTAWEERLERVERHILRLGPINLTAIDEFSQLSERKTYLDHQYADLTEALTTLETAIRQIDRETRTRFTETFDKVNISLKSMFPALFGGGHAYLELTGEDLLETGVTVMARPPGKRNSNIHLLSGGEKALTALALVFAIFELTPAPFCLLDEVDAPLDDANLVHLCDMLKSMSERVQFLFITHNKITMEIAERLIGVTMQEPGISRLVAVDVEEAVQMAATG